MATAHAALADAAVAGLSAHLDMVDTPAWRRPLEPRWRRNRGGLVPDAAARPGQQL